MALTRASLLMVVAIFILSSVEALTPGAFMKMRYPNIIRPQPANSSRASYSACSGAIDYLLTHKQALAAYVDASGRPPSGILSANLAWRGSYDECISIAGAHYCLANMFLNLTQLNPQKKLTVLRPITWGVCVPKQCGHVDIEIKLYELIHAYNLSKTIGFASRASPVACAAPSKYTTGVILTLTLCGIILFLCLVGTALETVKILMAREDNCSQMFCLVRNSDNPHLEINADVVDEADKETLIPLEPSKRNNIFLEILLCYSLIRNTKQIMNTKVPPGAITSLNGMRVMSMWWVILGHTILILVFTGNVVNTAEAYSVVHRFSFQAITNATFSVDSFFFLSGLLVSYLSLRQMDKRGKLPLFKFYFHRFWRLTPSYMFVILFYDKLMGFLGQGPLWYTQQQNKACDKYWWTNLLYINNFHPDSLARECLAWSWYLANDMQFYVISPIILYATYKFRVIGLIISTAPLFVAQVITTAVLFSHYNIVAVGGALNLVNDLDDKVYIKPYCRISVYLIGLVVGYLLHRQRGTVKRLPVVAVVLGWIMAIALAMLVVYGPYSVNKKGGTPFTKAENIAYGTFSRTAWGLAVAWVIYACQNGYGGVIDTILSARFWIPLSRLTYGAYLLHIIVLSVFYEAYTGTFAYSDVNYAFFFAGGCVISYAASFILAVCVEFPTMQLEKVLFRSRERIR